MAYILLTLIVANAAFLISNVMAFRRLRVVDQVLTQTCAMAFARAHAPVWMAWAATMGEISIEVNTVRKPWGQG